MVVRGWGKGYGELLIHGRKISVKQDEEARTTTLHLQTVMHCTPQHLLRGITLHVLITIKF